jgi:TorA maturation chaperone TorD
MGAILSDAAELLALARWLNFVGELWLEPPVARHREGVAALAACFPQEPALGEQRELQAFRDSWYRHLRIPGPQALLPYETSHLPAGVHPRGSERMAQIAACYATAGFPLEPFTQEPADHLGHELRFLAGLAALMAERLERGEVAGGEKVEAWFAGFARDHLLLWLGPFVAHCEAVAEDPFFPALARVSRALVEGAVG